MEGVGFRKGDVIVINMFMDVYVVIIYLVVIFVGCVVVLIVDSFVFFEIVSCLKIFKVEGIFI